MCFLALLSEFQMNMTSVDNFSSSNSFSELADEQKISFVLSSLKNMASIRANVKLSTRTQLGLYADENVSKYVQFLYRWWAGESRLTNIEDLQSHVEKAFDMISKCVAKYQSMLKINSNPPSNFTSSPVMVQNQPFKHPITNLEFMQQEQVQIDCDLKDIINSNIINCGLGTPTNKHLDIVENAPNMEYKFYNYRNDNENLVESNIPYLNLSTDSTESVEKMKVVRLLDRLLRELDGAQYGIKNLLETYKQDKLICSKVEVILDRISDRLADFRSAYSVVSGNQIIYK